MQCNGIHLSNYTDMHAWVTLIVVHNSTTSTSLYGCMHQLLTLQYTWPLWISQYTLKIRYWGIHIVLQWVSQCLLKYFQYCNIDIVLICIVNSKQLHCISYRNIKDYTMIHTVLTHMCITISFDLLLVFWDPVENNLLNISWGNSLSAKSFNWILLLWLSRTDLLLCDEMRDYWGMLL